MRWRKPPALSCCERMCASSLFGEPTFQDDAGRRRIDIRFDDAPPAQAGFARRFEPCRGLPRRIALVDQYGLQQKTTFEFSGELARGARHRTGGTIHIV